MRKPLALVSSVLLSMACASTPAPAPASATAAVPATPQAAAKPAEPPTPPAPPKQLTATDVVLRHRDGLDTCMLGARKVKPDLPHTHIDITYNLDDQGKLISVDFVYRNKVDEGSKDCFRNAAEAIKFPAYITGTQTVGVDF